MKSDDVKAAFGDGTNNSDSGYYSLAASSKVSALPLGWKGQFVRITPIGAGCWYLFSTSASAAVAIAASTDGGTFSPTQGEFVPSGTTAQVEVPYAPDGAPIYFARIGDALGSGVSITKASGKPGNNTEEGK